MSGGASHSAEWIANFALRIAASENVPQGVTDGSADIGALSEDATKNSLVAVP